MSGTTSFYFAMFRRFQAICSIIGPGHVNPDSAAPASSARAAPPNPDLAGRLGVARSTIGQWIATHPEFAEAVQQGRDVADATAVESLFTRVTGYNHQAEKVFLYRGETRAVTYTVHVPAEIRACMFWLRNRRPEDWRERSERALAEHAQQEAADAALRAELHEAQERMRRFRAEDGL